MSRSSVALSRSGVALSRSRVAVPRSRVALPRTGVVLALGGRASGASGRLDRVLGGVRRGSGRRTAARRRLIRLGGRCVGLPACRICDLLAGWIGRASGDCRRRRLCGIRTTRRRAIRSVHRRRGDERNGNRERAEKPDAEPPRASCDWRRKHSPCRGASTSLPRPPGSESRIVTAALLPPISAFLGQFALLIDTFLAAQVSNDPNWRSDRRWNGGSAANSLR